MELFRSLVLRPLSTFDVNRFNSAEAMNLSDFSSGNVPLATGINDSNCLIIAIDALDEAGFHRNDGDESIGWLLRQTTAEFPSWLRVIVTSSSVQPLYGLDVRTIRLDDVELDERVLRDSRIFIDYHLTINSTVRCFHKQNSWFDY